MRWLASGHDKIAFLTTRAAECSIAPREPALRAARDRGRAAFESPVLVGGSAGARGVSCASCHISGRDNPDFFIERLSGQPGTADVTSSLFSKVLEDGAFNPKPIPDLAARNGTQIKDRTSEAFRAKLRGLIVEEFAGQKPAASVFEDVRVYLDSLTLAGCTEPSAREALKVDDDLAAIATALEAASTGEKDAALFWIDVARRRLERIYERYQNVPHPRRAIEALNRRLASTQKELRDGRTPAQLSAKEWAAFSEAVRAGEARSLYNPQILRAAL